MTPFDTSPASAATAASPVATGAAPAAAAPQAVVLLDNPVSNEAALRIDESARPIAATPAPAAPPRTELASLPEVNPSGRPAQPPPAAASDAPAATSGALAWASPAGVPGSVTPASHTELTDAPLFQPGAPTATTPSPAGAPAAPAPTAPVGPAPAAASPATLPWTAPSANSVSPDANRYGHSADYSTLKGKLEYSAARKQWKLRYQPVDAPEGQVDQNGGSVLLPDAPELKQFHDGDFVTVEGSVGQRDPAAKDFAPRYELRQLKRLE